MLYALLFAAVTIAGLSGTQQSAPAAPEPKPTQHPLKFPSPDNIAVVASPHPQPPKTDNNRNEFDLPKDVLNGPERLMIEDFLQRQLKPVVQQHWEAIMPEEAKAHRKFGIYKNGKSGRVRLGFVLHKTGAITNVAVVESSGDKVMDSAAMTAIRESQPLRLPARFSKNELKVSASFYYNPKSRQW